MRYLVIICSLICISILQACLSTKKVSQKEANVLTKDEKNDGWKLLFNGSDLKNWRIFNDGEVTDWRIVDGILYNSGIGSDHGGDIITKKQYKDFILKLEWQATPNSNSGIFYHVKENIVDAIYKSGPEYQLADDIGRQDIDINKDQTTGALYGMYAPKNSKEKKLNEWNTSKIIVNGPHIEHWLNGKLVVEAELWTKKWYTKKDKSKWKDESEYGEAKRGHIGLQDHGGLTKFKNIKIKKL